jgi:hypothetical protein
MNLKASISDKLSKGGLTSPRLGKHSLHGGRRFRNIWCAAKVKRNA